MCLLENQPWTKSPVRPIFSYLPSSKSAKIFQISSDKDKLAAKPGKTRINPHRAAVLLRLGASSTSDGLISRSS